MPQKRSQFSSCDACRRSRVACDASRKRRQSIPSTWGQSCSRCLKRKRVCTFEWMTKSARPAHTSDGRKLSIIPYEPAAHNDGVAASTLDPSKAAQADAMKPGTAVTDFDTRQWSTSFLNQSFDKVFGISLGRYGCPFVSDAACDIYRSVFQLFGELDVGMGNYSGHQILVRTPTELERYQNSEDTIEECLQSATLAYASHWLHLASEPRLSESELRDFIRTTWRAARRNMLKALNLRSYRSILALYLFAQTPIPIDITPEEEVDGICRPVCMQNAFHQLQRLRERRESYQNQGDVMNTHIKRPTTSSLLDLENRAHWAAMMWDTAGSLALGLRTSLSSGLKGACSEQTWRLVQAFLTGSFTPRAQNWHKTDENITNEMASEIIAGACICKTYMWQHITSLKEGLREGVDDDYVLVAWRALLETIKTFTSVIHPLLERCREHISRLDPAIRLSLYSVNLQYCLGILILVDALEVAARQDLLSQISTVKQEAEHESFQVLKFGLKTSYTIHQSPARQEMAGNQDTQSDFASLSSATLVAVDPYPQYVVDLVLLLNRSLSGRAGIADEGHGTRSHPKKILFDSLNQLPQTSKSIYLAQQLLSGKAR
ncbi:hypothetical protein FB567DRAFT_524458 [Paraphoma chrysanthemicola]|uniref:Zn(2)-C6 fungal-type domain-containing protein n=1 Tax=Paraphoma chrysanthemicola TaxID=798071 RepID=A0A8K0VYZ9_9PLEO|nr:hypothetical protein FB567DRAFT_524458 [Paraphoma chrysanthemicola]